MNVKRYFRQKQQAKRKGRSYLTELENLQVILAYTVDQVTWVHLCNYFGLDPAEYETMAKMDDIRQAAIQAGVKLVQE